MSNKIESTELEQETTGGLLPQLRFPEFQDAPEWDQRQLSQLTTKISDGIHTTPVYDEHGEYAFINGNNLINGKIVIDEKTKRVNLAEYNKHKKPLSINSILISINGTIGNLALFRAEQVILGKSACFINVDRKLVNKLFIYYIIQTDKVKGAFNAELTGSTIKNLSLGTIKNIQLLVPALPEQQKIADCLSSIDDLIAAQSQKLAALKTHKKGLMQQLFPAEGETLPQLRFPEFQDAPEWEERLLEQYFTHIRNGFVGTATPYYVSSGIPYLQGKNIKQGQIEANELVTISKDFHRKQQKSQLRINDILMVQSGHVGECALVDQKFAGGNCHALIIMSPKKNIHPSFFVYYFYSPKGRNEISQIKKGNTIAHVLTSDLKSIKVCVPSFDEQQKIAACFSALDDLITAQTQKLAALKAHKKGLMQQLFPTPEDVQA